MTSKSLAVSMLASTRASRLMDTARVRALGSLSLIALAMACGGGGGEKPVGPGRVASVEVSAPATSLAVGDIMYLSVKYFDAAHKQLSGQTITYATSDPSVATVNTSGAITGVAPGTANITATVSGAHGSVTLTVFPVPVSSVAITPAKPSVRQGETTQLAAQPLDAIGRQLTGRTVSWSSANVSIATISATGLVTGVLAGSVYIRATSEGHTDSVSLRVKGLNAPNITGTSGGLLTPGATGALSGVNFGATPNDNEVYVNGAAATVTAASPTNVSFTVPAAVNLPCTATGPAQVMLVANGDTTVATMQLRMATQRALAVGQSAIYTSQVDLMCNEFSNTGGRYLVTAFNYAPDAALTTDFQLLGASTASASQASIAASLMPSPQSGPAITLDDPLRRHEIAHLAFQQRQRAFAQQMGNPHLRERMRRPNGALLNTAAVVAPPNVGDVVTYRMPKTLGSYATYDNVRFRAVYVGSKIIIFEDSLAPLAGTMDIEYQRMGQEFDNVIWDVLLNFGNPLVVDSALDNNGHMIALFTPRVNNYTINGTANVLLGYVTLCDYFPRVQQVVNGQTIPACPASNEAEAFYAIVPEPGVSGAVQTVVNWRRYMRSTLAHEAKHVTSYAERYYRDAEEIEDTWLEEATAQVSSEIFSRIIYNHQQQFGDLGWNDGPNCDYASVSASCQDPMEGILHHFSFLYEAYSALESKSVVDASNASPDRVIYGYSWSFVRWVTDTYGTTEGDFLRSLVQVKNDHGVQNIESKSGHTFAELLGRFSLACVADNYPSGVVSDPKLQLQGWNSRDIFLGMNQHLFYSGGVAAFPLAFPLHSRAASFGSFGSGTGQVTALRGGGFAAWEISGVQSAPQVLAIRDPQGGLPQGQIGLAIVRVQ